MTIRLLGVVLLAAGCGPARNPGDLLAYDPATARGVLATALDEWKAGRAAGLGKRSPPVRFVDDDLAAGALLLDYKMPASGPAKAFESVRVELTLRTRQGQTATRPALYQVVLSPSPAVLRAD